jgi:hypothetical protein
MSRDIYEKSMIIELGEKVFYIMSLNVLWILCSLPLVTIGAATAAMNYTCIKLRRDEGDSFIRMFFRSFAQNFRQALIIWTGMFAVLILLFAFTIQMIGSLNAGHTLAAFGAVTGVLIFLVILTLIPFTFFVLARFENTLLRTLTNAVYLAVRNPSVTWKVLGIMMFDLIIVPVFLWMYFPYGFPLVIFFDIPLTAWILAGIYNRLFEQFIPE